MTQRDGWQEASAQLVKDVLASNMAKMLLGRRTREMLCDVEAKGRPVLLSDGVMALAVGGHILGAAAEPLGVRETVASVGQARDAVALVFGLGIGTTVRELRAFSTAPTIVFEPDPGVLKRVMELGPLDLAETPIVCDLEDLREGWWQLSGGSSTATLVVSPGYAEAYPEEHEELAMALKTILSSTSINENTLRSRTRKWVEHMLENLPRTIGTYPMLSLAGAYTGVPAFIVGAGPSLERNAHLLPEAARKGIVFALNSSAKVIDAHGAEAQVLACLESIDHSDQFRGISWIGRTIRAFSLAAHPADWRIDGGPVMATYEANPMYAAIGTLLGVPGIQLSGSVSTMAFSIADALGCSPIVFVGQDLAYTDDRYHASGTDGEKSRVRVDRASGTLRYEWCEDVKRKLAEAGSVPSHERLLEVETWGGGGLVACSAAHVIVRNWLEARAKELELSRPEAELINATEGGSRIPGFREEPLTDVLARLTDRWISAASMAECASRARSPVRAEDVTAWATKYARNARKAAVAAEGLATAVRSAQELTKAKNAKGVRKAYARVSAAEKHLRDKVAGIPLLDVFCSAAVHSTLEAADEAVRAIDAGDLARDALATELQVAESVVSAAREMESRLQRVAEVSRS